MHLTRVLPLLLLIFNTGCVTTIGALGEQRHDISRNYSAPFDKTWEAVVDVMQRYPVITIEKASGLLITDWVDGISDVYYEESVGERQMLKDRARLNIKVSPLSNGESRVTVNQYVKIYVNTVTNPLYAGPPIREWQDVSGIKDLPVRTSSKREQEILDAIDIKLKQ